MKKEEENVGEGEGKGGEEVREEKREAGERQEGEEKSKRENRKTGKISGTYFIFCSKK